MQRCLYLLAAEQPPTGRLTLPLCKTVVLQTISGSGRQVKVHDDQQVPARCRTATNRSATHSGLCAPGLSLGWLRGRSLSLGVSSGGDPSAAADPALALGIRSPDMMAAMQSQTALVESKWRSTSTPAAAVRVITAISCSSRAALSSPLLLAASTKQNGQRACLLKVNLRSSCVRFGCAVVKSRSPLHDC